MRELLRRSFGCDVRSLAALRIAVGLLLLADLGWRLPRFSFWLTEAGAWPIAAAQAEQIWSLYFLAGSPAWTISLLSFAAVAAIALIAGWRTRCVTIISWILLVSLQARNDLPLNAGDTVLRLLLFWGIFIPWGACWSADARREGSSSGTVFSMGTAALLIQVALIYGFNALYKTGETWKDGTAIAITLQEETYATALGSWLRQWPALLAAGTRATWWLELLGPALAMLPLRNGILRGGVALAFMGFHLALFATIRIGLFPIICIAAWLAFLPAGFWNALRFRAGNAAPPQPKLFPQLAAGAALAMVLAINIASFAKVKIGSWLNWPARCLGLRQQWSLFAPNPNRSEGWMVVVIETADGKEYDALTGREVDWARPAHLGKVLPSASWRKYLASLRIQKYPARVQQFAAWCAREWQASHPDAKVQRVRVHYLWEWLAQRQDPPDHWFIYENPPGPLTEEARKLGYPVAPADTSDL